MSEATAGECTLKAGWLSAETYCAVHGRSSGWPCATADDTEPARTKPTRASLLADLAATTAADAKVIWNRALNGGAA